MRQQLGDSEVKRWEAVGGTPALQSRQPIMSRWSMTLSSGPSKRSPNHINHRLTLGSSPAHPHPPNCTSAQSLKHKALPQNTNGGIIGCESRPHVCLDKKAKKKKRDSCSSRMAPPLLPDVAKRIRIWQKEDCSAPPYLRRLRVRKVKLTLLNLKFASLLWLREAQESPKEEWSQNTWI